MNIKNIKIVFLLFLILLLALLLRTVKLGEIPPGISDDEAAVGYDTYLLTQSGKDQWGINWPLEFKGFGDYRLPLYQYLLFPLVKLFGLNGAIIRLPSALCGLATIIVLYKLVLLIFANFKYKSFLAIIAAFLLTINPWHLGMSRWIMEANVGLFFSLLVVFFVIRNKRNDWWLSAIFTAMAFYSYYSLRLFLPLYIFFLIIYLRQSFKKNIIGFAVFVFILLIPIVINTFITGGSLSRVKQLNLTKDTGTIDQINEHRGQCLVSNFPVVCSLIYNRPVFWTKQFLYNYYHHFSFSFLFFEKFERGWNFLPPTGFFYFFELPFFVIGMFTMAKGDNKSMLILLIWMLIAPLADSVTNEGHYARSFIIVIPVIIYISYGYLSAFMVIKKLFQKSYYIFLLFLGVFNSIFISQFFIDYFYYFSKTQSSYSHYEYQPLFAYLEQVESNYDNIYISKVNHDQRQYIFYLYYFKVPPEKYFILPKNYLVEENGWIWVQQLGKFNFINQANRIANYPSKSLLIIHPNGIKNLPEYGKPIAVINYLNGDRAFNIYDLDLIKTELAKLEKNDL